MAHDINQRLLREIRRPSNWRGIIRHKLRRQINATRRARRKKVPGADFQGAPSTPTSVAGVSDRFEHGKAHFREHGWAYIEDFFSDSMHSTILGNWPDLCWFELKANPSKSYDFGPHWTKRQKNRVIGIGEAFYSGFDCLSSEEFARRVSEFCGDGVRRATGGPHAVWARPGSHLLPHLDDVSVFGNSIVNFVIFIDGSSPSLSSGGTSFFATNTFDQPLFVPRTLRNSALVYSTGASVYHGFPKVARGKFSKRIIVNFQPVDLLEKDGIVA